MSRRLPQATWFGALRAALYSSPLGTMRSSGIANYRTVHQLPGGVQPGRRRPAPAAPHYVVRRPVSLAPPTSLASGLPPSMRGLAAPIDAALAPIAGIITAPFEALMGPSLSSSACVPGQSNWPACAIPGGSVEALEHGGLPPAAAAFVASQAGSFGGGALALSSVDARPLRER